MPPEKTFCFCSVEEGERPLAPHTPRYIPGRVPPRGCAKRMQSQRHLKHELGPGKALSVLEPLGHFKRKSIDPRRIITAMSSCNQSAFPGPNSCLKCRWLRIRFAQPRGGTRPQISRGVCAASGLSPSSTRAKTKQKIQEEYSHR